MHFAFFKFQQWVLCYRKDRLLRDVNTNNGVEGTNGRFKKNYLPAGKSPSLSRLSRIITTQFIPDEIQR